MQFQSLSAISGTILSIFSTKKRDRISAKTECCVLTDDQVLSRITLWAPNDRCDLETFGSIVVKNARKLNYYGDCFSTCSISAVHRTPASQIEALNPLRWVKRLAHSLSSHRNTLFRNCDNHRLMIRKDRFIKSGMSRNVYECVNDCGPVVCGWTIRRNLCQMETFHLVDHDCT